MKKSGVFIILLLFLLASCSKNKPSVVINRALIDDALAYGEKNASLSFYEFVKPWTIDLGYQVGKGYTTLLTPFLRVAILGKNTYEQKGTVDIIIENEKYFIVPQNNILLLEREES